MNAAEIARKALEILDRDGWCKGTTVYPRLTPISPRSYRTGSHCIGGAWSMAATGDAAMNCLDSVMMPLIEVIREQYPEIRDSVEAPVLGLPKREITLFNDLPGTTEADVRAILEKIGAS